MYRELIISTIIIISIFLLDYITQKYTDTAINELVQDLSKICEELKDENSDKKELTKEANEKYKKWLRHHDRLAFYIEHNELEKIETSFVAGKSYIETAKSEDAVSELEKTIFILEHINEKYSINFANIF